MDSANEGASGFVFFSPFFLVTTSHGTIQEFSKELMAVSTLSRSLRSAISKLRYAETAGDEVIPVIICPSADRVNRRANLPIPSCRPNPSHASHVLLPR